MKLGLFEVKGLTEPPELGQVDRTGEEAQRSARGAVIQHQIQTRWPTLWAPDILLLLLCSAEIAFAQ